MRVPDAVQRVSAAPQSRDPLNWNNSQQRLDASLGIRVFALAGGMLDGEDNNFLSLLVSSVIN